MIKEPYMFDILILLITINSVRDYDNFKSEISVTLKLLVQLLTFDKGNLLIAHHQKILRALTNIRVFQRDYSLSHPEHYYEAFNSEIDKYVVLLEKLTFPLQDIQNNFCTFINSVSRYSRYIILDIQTYLKKDFKFNSLIEPSFPFGNKKLLFQRLNLYLEHFKTGEEMESPIFYIMGVLKVFTTALKVNKSFFL